MAVEPDLMLLDEPIQGGGREDVQRVCSESGLQIFKAAAWRVGSEIAARIGCDRNLSDMELAVDVALKTDLPAVLKPVTLRRADD